MPEGYQAKYRREVENSSELLYVRKMKSFYESTLQDLGKMLGKKTEFNVVVTMDVLSKVEERLSDFERKEKEIMKKYRNFSEAILV
jgi:hypothetical protein